MVGHRGDGPGINGDAEPDVLVSLHTSGPDEPDQYRSAAELSKILAERDKILLEMGQLEGTALNPQELQVKKERLLTRDALEVAKVSAERDKLRIELAQLRGGALRRDELRAKKEDEAQRRSLELQKLRRESKNARWSPYFEFLKAVVPALAIAVSITVAAWNISAQRDRDREAAQVQRERDREAAQLQRDRDRSVAVSQQLARFQAQMAEKDSAKQRFAIAEVRSARQDAIPSLLANLDVDHPNDILTTLSIAILDFNEDQELRPVVMRGLLSWMKNVALRPNLPHFQRYIFLWQQCLDQYEKDNAELFKEAAAEGTRLAQYLRQHVPSKISGELNLELMMRTIALLELNR